MLRPGRLFMLALLGAVIYVGFFAEPASRRDPGAFDPAVAATHEAAIWQSAAAREDFGVYFNTVLLLRDLHGYTWFRAARAAYPLSQATLAFVGQREKYERLLPDLQEAAEDEKAWTSASFDPAAVARAQLTAWLAPRTPGIDPEDVAERIADELALRYDLPAGLVMEAALQRANALALSGEGGVDPDWPSITRTLTVSYASLGGALRRTHARRAPRTAP
ncbi:MAG TPA: hypothetical protein VG538_10110 [Vicinamibacterales bacterium]|jgi:hypothetical protein|nr:hypothetical protein [Vicinamibacterales bacterium]